MLTPPLWAYRISGCMAISRPTFLGVLAIQQIEQGSRRSMAVSLDGDCIPRNGKDRWNSSRRGPRRCHRELDDGSWHIAARTCATARPQLAKADTEGAS